MDMLTFLLSNVNLACINFATPCPNSFIFVPRMSGVSVLSEYCLRLKDRTTLRPMVGGWRFTLTDIPEIWGDLGCMDFIPGSRLYREAYVKVLC